MELNIDEILDDYEARRGALPRNDEQFVSVERAAEHLGVGRTTLWRWSRNGVGPRAVKIGPRASRYQVGELRRFIAERKGAANV